MKISRCIAAALLVAATTIAGCSSCAKDDAKPAPVPSDTPPQPVGDLKVLPLPRNFERRTPAGIENLATAVPAPVVSDAGDAGLDATTH